MIGIWHCCAHLVCVLKHVLDYFNISWLHHSLSLIYDYLIVSYVSQCISPYNTVEPKNLGLQQMGKNCRSKCFLFSFIYFWVCSSPALLQRAAYTIIPCKPQHGYTAACSNSEVGCGCGKTDSNKLRDRQFAIKWSHLDILTAESWNIYEIILWQETIQQRPLSLK